MSIPGACGARIQPEIILYISDDALYEVIVLKDEKTGGRR